MADVTLKALLLGDDYSASRALKGVAREIDDVTERLLVLSRMDATPEVKLKTEEAQAKLARLQAEMKALGAETEETGKRTEHTSKQMGMLATSLLAVGPAIVPIAAGAAGLAVGFGAMGSAGVLAILGIRNEMKAGTALGDQFAASVDTLQGNLHTLERTAAAGVLGSFQTEVSRLQTQVPSLNTIIGQMSVMTGHVATNITNGLVSAFITLEPLMRDVGVYAEHLSERFQAMMTGQGITAFGDYARSVLPQVTTFVGNLATTAGHLVTAFAPLGGGVLSGLTAVSNVISALPVGLLQGFATAAGDVFIGFRTWQGLSGLIGPATSALKGFSVAEDTVAVATKAMNISFGLIGVAMAGFAYIMGQGAETTRQNEQAVNDLKDALIQSNGVLDEHVRKVQYDNLVSSGTMDTYKALGGNVRDLVDASLGYGDAQQRVNDILAASKPAAEDFGAAGVIVNGQVVDLTDATKKVRDGVFGANDQLKAGQQAQKDYATATANSTVAAQGSTLALQDQTTASQADRTAIQNLNSAIDQMLGHNLSLAQATTAVDQAQLNMFNTLKQNKGTMREHTQAGIQDRQVIESTAAALQQKRDNQIKEKVSIAEATRQYEANSDALLKQIGRLYGTKSAVYQYAQQLLKVPKDVKTTITANTAQAVSATQRVLNMLAGIKNKDVSVTVNYLNALNKPHVGPPGSNAGGTNNWRGGLTWVGEEGPELLDLPAGSRIYSHPQSVSMASAVAGGSGTGGSGRDLNLTVNLRAPDGRVIQQELLRVKLNGGGAALGLA